MKTSISCAAAAVALTALAGASHAQLLGGATGMVGNTAKGALASAPVGSTLNSAGGVRSTALGAAASTAGSVRGDVAELRSQGRDLGQSVMGQVRSVQGEAARSHAVSGQTSGQTDLIAGDLHAVFRDYAGLNGRTNALDTRGLTDHANDTARMAVRKVRNRGGDVIEITRDRAGETVERIDDVRDETADRTRGVSTMTVQRVQATTHRAAGVTRSDVQRVVAAAHDLKAQAPNARPAVRRVVDAAHDLRRHPLPNVHADAAGSAALTVASTDAGARAKAQAGARSRRATAGVTVAGASS